LEAWVVDYLIVEDGLRACPLPTVVANAVGAALITLAKQAKFDAVAGWCRPPLMPEIPEHEYPWGN